MGTERSTEKSTPPAMRRSLRSDVALWARAGVLSARYLGGHAQPSSVRWVDTMAGRWGSCTPSAGTIRISRRVEEMPAHVRDYVLLHELTHLLIPGHGPNFWTLMASYPHVERARGFLEGVDHASGQFGDSAPTTATLRAGTVSSAVSDQAEVTARG